MGWKSKKQLDELSTPDNRKNGQHIIFNGLNIEFSMTGIHHQYADFLVIDAERVDNITNCGAFAYLFCSTLKRLSRK